MSASPEANLAGGGDTFKQILLHTLEQIEFVENGGVFEEPVYVATTRGAVEIRSANTELIREDIDKAMGKSFPGMFVRQQTNKNGLDLAPNPRSIQTG